MTPKEKANILVLKFIIVPDDALKPDSGKAWIDKKLAKQSATICVDEILSSFNNFMDSRRYMRHELEIDAERYWLEVKKEIDAI